MTVAIVAGHLCLDIIPDLSAQSIGQFDASFKPGRLVQSGPARLTTGGAVSNTGIALHHLGIQTRLIARIGDDPLGKTLRQCVADQGEGLADGLIQKSESSTSYSVVISPPGVDRRFLHNPGANDDFLASDVRDEELKSARLFHFGYPPLMEKMYANDGSQLRKLFERARSFGLITSLDMAYPDPDSPAGQADWPAILRNVLPFVDVFVPSLDEIAVMLWHETNASPSKDLLKKTSDTLLGMGTGMTLLKLGNRGLYLRTANPLNRQGIDQTGKIWSDFEACLPCFKVNVVGTTGAGDVTVAGFLAGLLRGLPPHEAMTGALAVGACCVEAADALSGILSWEGTWQRIRSGWETHREPEGFSKS
jgi:sugar/nucleoside kinase (ribokinase family)